MTCEVVIQKTIQSRYLVKFIKDSTAIKERIWASKSCITTELRKCGALTGGRGKHARMKWPLYTDKPITFSVKNPPAWYWNE